MARFYDNRAEFAKKKKELIDKFDKYKHAFESQDKRHRRIDREWDARKALTKDGMTKEEAMEAYNIYNHTPGWAEFALRSDTYAQDELKEWLEKNHPNKEK